MKRSEVTVNVSITEDSKQLNDTFAALANETRRAILARLVEGEASVNELAAPFDMSLPAISRHIKVLERAGLIVQGQRAQYRPCTLEPEPLKQVANWTEQYRPIWEERFDRMDSYLQDLQANKAANQTANQKSKPKRKTTRKISAEL